MNEHQFNISVEPELYKDLQELKLTTYIENHLGQKTRMMHAEVYNLKEQALRNALIELGWTPPKEKAR